MVQIPDSAKPYVDGFLKYHFWILAAIVPFVLVPSVFSANDSLRQRITSQKSSIDGHVSALRTIQNEPEHPNVMWVETVDRRTNEVRAGILGQWQIFWASQQPLRVWPQELGGDFLAAIQAVEAGQQDRLPANLLQRYQNTVPDIVRKLPSRMGCKDLMFEDAATLRGRAAAGATASDDPESPEASLTLDPLVWRAEDQKRLLTSFTWHREPSTAQVRLAQEELWVYGIVCDAIRKLNAGATGAFNATITSVEELAVGFPAAEEIPGGRGGGRIFWKSSPVAATPTDDEEGPAPDRGEGVIARPSHPRFDPSASAAADSSFSAPAPSSPPIGGELGEEGVPAVATSADDLLLDWIYVDFQGRPLMASALKKSEDATMVHLVPFTLRVVMDQRKIDQLLQNLAENTIPIDVRQVRINPNKQSNPMGGPLASGGGGGFSDTLNDPTGRRRRPYDVQVELRGSVGLATPPDEKPLGGASDDNDVGGLE